MPDTRRDPRSVNYVQQLIFGSERFRRYTQDSPILPDVWRAFCADPKGRQALLLTPHFAATPGALTVKLRHDFEHRQQQLPAGVVRPRMAYNQLAVATSLSFEELVFLVLPRTAWWQQTVQPHIDGYRKRLRGAEQLGRDLRAFHLGTVIPEHRAEATILWMAALVGAVLWAKGDDHDISVEQGIETLVQRWLDQDASRTVPAVPPEEIYLGVGQVLRGAARYWKGVEVVAEEQTIWRINLDRPVETAQSESVQAIKADAARRLFEIDCSAIRWAVIDSGIDASHPALWCEPDDDETGADGSDLRDPKQWPKWTRVRASYDFTRVRHLLDLDWVEAVADGDAPEVGADLAAVLAQALKGDASLADELEDLRLHLLKGRQIDWGVLERFLRIEHSAAADAYPVPGSSHGTHVAGILGARDVLGGEPGGVCPDIGLYDLRILDAAGQGDEFYVISALQFVRHLNSHQDYLVVHGANLSLSIRHEVRSFACGATPVCEEAERLMASGVVVVAAAGNRGYQVFELADERQVEGFLAISITDPGNAEKILTVGATHRSNPHTFGVSYFSSRGPTGDGRCKPDLVAPGEKILAPVPGGRWEVKDGTSMAAPHVSGAAAMVLARNAELQGKSDRVKEILCASATDLGRERYFQGHGLVDVLRALQSV